MTTAVNTIEVALPDGVSASPQDVEMLSSLLRVIASLRFEEGRDWPRLSRALELGGWRVSWGLQWHVEVRRDRELELACGRTLDEAFAAVWQVAGREHPEEGTP